MHVIVIDNCTIGAEKGLALYCTEFHVHKIFSVRIGDYNSPQKERQNGVPQERELRLTRFALKLNGKISQVNETPRFRYSLYVDTF